MRAAQRSHQGRAAPAPDEGKTVEEVQSIFREAFDGVAASEISAAEQALISEGLPVSEVQRLCDVHSAVFKGSIEEIHAPADVSQVPGHPTHTPAAENEAITAHINERIRPLLSRVQEGKLATQTLLLEIGALLAIDLHYSRRKNLLFPYLEQHGVTAPPKVMWGVDDEIRALLKDAAKLAAKGSPETAEKLSQKRRHPRGGDLSLKEENILIPMLIETLSAGEFSNVARESGAIGYCMIAIPPVWQASSAAEATTAPAAPVSGSVQLPRRGSSPFRSLAACLTRCHSTSPFVGADDTVRYFSQGSERVFPRTKAIIGRKVANCHPPASVHIVEGIINDFKSGKKDHEDFWIKLGDKFVYIRYFAVRDETEPTSAYWKSRRTLRRFKRSQAKKGWCRWHEETERAYELDAQQIKTASKTGGSNHGKQNHEEYRSGNAAFAWRTRNLSGRADQSRTLVQNRSVSLTLFAFDTNEEISSHESKGDAMVQVLDGKAKITIGGGEYFLCAGETVSPAGVPHALEAVEPFKMLLTVIFPGS